LKVNETSTQSQWFGYYRPNPAANVRLFCFPFAGGNAMSYRTWANFLPKEIEVCPIELPGRGSRLREKPVTQLETMIKAIAADLFPFFNNKPYAIFGHSMGALIGFELIRYLRKMQAQEPVHLFVSGHIAPHVPYNRQPIYDLPDAEFVTELRKLNGTPQAVLDNDELMQLLIPILRADFAANETYVYEDDIPLNCPITAFGGLQDKDVSRADIEAWQKHTSSSFSMYMLPGDHFFLQNVFMSILQKITTHLERDGISMK